MEQPYQLDLLRVDPLSPRKIRRRHGLEPEVVPRIPTISRRTRHVLEPGIRGEDAVIQVRERAEYGQRRHLPGTVTQELSGESLALVRAVGVEQLLLLSAPQGPQRVTGLLKRRDGRRSQCRLIRRTAQQEDGQVLDAALTGLGSGERPTGDRPMPDDGHVELLRFRHDCRVDLAGQQVVHLDEISAHSVQGVDDAPSLFCARERDAALPDRRRAVEDLSGRYEAGLGQAVLGEANMGTRHEVKAAPHLPHARHAVDEEQRSERRKRTRPRRMDVHVPQARDEKLAGRVECKSALWYPDGSTRSERRDAIPSHRYGHVRLGWSAGHVDDGDVGECEGNRRRPGLVLGSSCQRNGKQSQEGKGRNAGHWVSLGDRKSTRLNSSHGYISYAVFCLKKKKDKIPVFDPHQALLSPLGIAELVNKVSSSQSPDVIVYTHHAQDHIIRKEDLITG